eukprot:gene9137-10087_t
MFGRPHRISPTCRVADVDHTFTKVCKNFTEPRPPDSPSTRTTSTTSTLRTGDGLSYSTNANVVLNVPANNARQMFRVLNCTEDRHGHRIFFDSIDGRIYGKGPAMNNRVSQDVVLYDSKSAALSERFPSNQVGGGRGGNGIHARVLVSFDAWGETRRRYGGGSSVLVQNAKMMKIIQFLDPPYPVSKRLCDRYVEPFFFTKADRRKPNREVSNHAFKINRFCDRPHANY